MVELSKKGYIKQIILYIDGGQGESAYSLAKEFTGKMPKEMIGQFLLAKAAFGMKKYEDAADAGRKAFNLASTDDDLATCALLASTAYYMQKEYAKGYDFLGKVAKLKDNEEIQQMLFLFSVAMADENAAMKHMENLFEMNEKTASALLAKTLEGIKKAG